MGKQVQDTLKRAQDLIEVAKAHGPAIGQAVDELVAPFMPRGTRPATGALIAGLMGAVAHAADDLIAKQEVLESELADDAAPRAARDEVANKLYNRVVGFRSTVESTCGQAAVRALAITGNTPRDPGQLLTLARTMLRNASKAKLEPTQPGVTIDVRTATRGIANLCDELEGHIKAVRREDKEADAALIARNQSQDVLEARTSATAGVLEELCLAVGMVELSERVRPATRRALARGDGGSEGGEDQEGSGSEGSGSGGSGSGGSGGEKPKA